MHVELFRLANCLCEETYLEQAVEVWCLDLTVCLLKFALSLRFLSHCSVSCQLGSAHDLAPDEVIKVKRLERELTGEGRAVAIQASLVYCIQPDGQVFLRMIQCQSLAKHHLKSEPLAVFCRKTTSRSNTCRRRTCRRNRISCLVLFAF